MQFFGKHNFRESVSTRKGEGITLIKERDPDDGPAIFNDVIVPGALCAAYGAGAHALYTNMDGIVAPTAILIGAMAFTYGTIALEGRGKEAKKVENISGSAGFIGGIFLLASNTAEAAEIATNHAPEALNSSYTQIVKTLTNDDILERTGMTGILKFPEPT